MGKARHLKRDILLECLKNGEIFKLFNGSYILQDLIFDPIECAIAQDNLNLVFEEMYSRTYMIVVGDIQLPFHKEKITVLPVEALENIP